MVILVTGCRSGIGLHTAVQAGRAGHVVYAGLRDVSTAGELVREAVGFDVHPVQLDVTSATERAEVVATIVERHGRIDGLVNNAGVALGGFLEQVESDELRAVFEVNVFGAWALTKQVLPSMRARRSGAVVMVSSMSGRMAIPGLGTYAGSKFALEGMSEAWRHELVPFGVRVTLVEPGAHRTDIFGRNRIICRRGNDPSSPYAPYAQRIEQLYTRFVDRQVGDPADVAPVIVDLLEADRPALRHPVGRDARLRLALGRLTPFRLVEAMIERALR